MMKIEIWSDVACPFCYIGKHHLEKALQNLGAEAEIIWRSFELDPYAPKNQEEDIYTLLANKYHQTREWAINSAIEMRQRGDAVGLTFNFDKLKPTNTFDAHRLLHLAKEAGRQNETKEALFEAYFRDGMYLAEYDTLMQVGLQTGLEKNALKSMLQSDSYADAVREDELLARRYGISAVPFFVINDKYGISGAQPIQYFEQTFIKILSEKESSVIANANQDTSLACDEDGCDV